MKIGAYFYPITVKCSERAKRARHFGSSTIDECELMLNAKPLYPGHNQPHRYCLGDVSDTCWDDSDAKTMARQVELAQEYGLSFFIFDTYVGHRNGKPVHELEKPLENAFLTCQASLSMEFAVMLCFASTHAYLPLPNRGAGFEEPNRCYDLTSDSIEYIIQYLVTRYFSQPNYLHVSGLPYVAIYPDLGPGRRTESHYRWVIRNLRKHASRHGRELYIVGVSKTTQNAQELANAGADALTGYAFLPDFCNTRANPIQLYSDLLADREKEWYAAVKIGLPFVPPAVVGWDASARGVQGFQLEQVAGVYPFTPIVEGGTPELFAEMLRKATRFVGTHVATEEQYVPICAWNEISEGCALLPEIKRSGGVDFSYLEMVKRVACEQTERGVNPRQCRIRTG